MKIYVASSWRNLFQPSVVQALRADGHTVYDFKNSEGFRWSELDENWKDWTPRQYIENLTTPRAIQGYSRDMEALMACDACVMVMPCGPSASMEMGWAVGKGKRVAVYVPAMREPDLMVKMAELATCNLQAIREWARDIDGTKKPLPNTNVRYNHAYVEHKTYTGVGCALCGQAKENHV